MDVALKLADDIVVINSFDERRSAVLAAAGVRRLRAEHARDDAARVLVQFAAWRVHRAARASAHRSISIRSAWCRTSRSRWPRARSRRGHAAIGSWCARRCSRSTRDFGIDLTVPFGKLPEAAAVSERARRKRSCRRQARSRTAPSPSAKEPGRSSKGCCRTCGADTKRAAGRSRRSSSRIDRSGRAPACHGQRLRPQSLSVRVKGRNDRRLRRTCRFPRR